MSGEEQIEKAEAEEVDPLIDATIGNYKIVKRIGEGGMGSVYLAEHPLIGKKVALKVLHAEFASNQEVVTRFFNEAKAVNDIQHPNIVDIIDYGVIPSPSGDMVYFIMEHLDGYSLDEVIQEQAPLSPERSLHICAQVADALAASHKSNIVHRDLKPDNIILIKKRNNDDFVKLLDFGIAKLTGDQSGGNKTRNGVVMGTPAYMSPEQCEGRGNIDNRTDVYALGVVMYQMITGRVPFKGDGYGEILVQHLTQTPVPPTTLRGVIPPHVGAVCMKALEKLPANRFQSMEDFIAALTDPVGFVEAHGGLGGFHSADLNDLNAIVGPDMARGDSGPYTPGPASLATTGSVQIIAHSGTPHSGALHSGALHSGAPHSGAQAAAPKSKAPIAVGVGMLAVAGIVAAALLGGGGDKAKSATQEPEPAEIEAAAAAVPVNPEPVEPDLTEAPVEKTVKVVKVRASVTSKPRGAEIYGPDGFIKNTPAKLTEFESDDLPMTLVLRKDGYEDFEITWEFNEDQRKQRYNLPEAALVKVPKSSSRRNPKVRKHSKDPKDKHDPKTIGDNNMDPDF